MNLKEISDLIQIRQYMCNSISNSNIDKATVNSLNSMIILLDNKIISLLQSESFKTFIDFKDIKKAINEINKDTSIKSGMIKRPR